MDWGGTKQAMIRRLAQISLMLMIASLIWMKYPVMVGGLPAFPADALFLLTFALWAASLATRQSRFSWHPALWLLVAYFVAMALSATQAPDPLRSGFKLLTQIYLLSLPLLIYNLIDSVSGLRRLFRTWIAASGVLAFLGTVTVLLFPLLGRESALAPMLHRYGTLRPGPYPRLELTFVYPAMLVSFLAASLMVLLVSRRLGWIGRRLALVLGGGMLLTAFFALSPGFGGLMFMLGLWCWAVLRRDRPRAALASLGAGTACALGALLAATVTPILHSTAPFLIHFPGFPVLAPSARLLAWIDALQNFAAAPLLGNGIGTDAVYVPYQSPVGTLSPLTDAHNGFLNIASQSGIAGLAALLAIIVYATKQAMPEPANLVRFGLATAFVSGIAVQGLVGSFEDARHLWILFGLMLAAGHLWPDGRDMVPVAGPTLSA